MSFTATSYSLYCQLTTSYSLFDSKIVLLEHAGDVKIEGAYFKHVSQVVESYLTEMLTAAVSTADRVILLLT